MYSKEANFANRLKFILQGFKRQEALSKKYDKIW